jgi:hypothetical protein
VTFVFGCRRGPETSVAQASEVPASVCGLCTAAWLIWFCRLLSEPATKLLLTGEVLGLLLPTVPHAAGIEHGWSFGAAQYMHVVASSNVGRFIAKHSSTSG